MRAGGVGLVAPGVAVATAAGRGVEQLVARRKPRARGGGEGPGLEERDVGCGEVVAALVPALALPAAFGREGAEGAAGHLPLAQEKAAVAPRAAGRQVQAAGDEAHALGQRGRVEVGDERAGEAPGRDAQARVRGVDVGQHVGQGLDTLRAGGLRGGQGCPRTPSFVLRQESAREKKKRDRPRRRARPRERARARHAGRAPSTSGP